MSPRCLPQDFQRQLRAAGLLALASVAALACADPNTGPKRAVDRLDGGTDTAKPSTPTTEAGNGPTTDGGAPPTTAPPTTADADPSPPDAAADAPISAPPGMEVPVADAGVDASAPPDVPDAAAPGTVVPWRTLGRCKEHMLLPDMACFDPENASKGVWDVAFSPDGQFLLAAGGGAVYVWKVTPTGLVVEEPLVKPGTGQDPSRIAFSPDGKKVAVFSRIGQGALMKFPERTREASGFIGLEALSPTGSGVGFSPDGLWVVASDGKGQIASFHLSGLRETTKSGTQLPTDRRTFAVAPKRPVGAPPAGVPQPTTPGGPLPAPSVYVAFDDPRPGMEGVIIMDTKDGSSTKFKLDTAVTALGFSDDGGTLAVAQKDGYVRRLDVRNPKIVQEPAFPPAFYAPNLIPMDLAYSTTGKHLVVAFAGDVVSHSGRVQVLSEDAPRLRGYKDFAIHALSAAFSSDGKALAVGLKGCGRVVFCQD